MQCTKIGAAINRLGISIKYLRRTTSGAAGDGLSRCQGLRMCPFTTFALHSPLVRASFAYKPNSSAGGWIFGASVCAWSPSFLLVFIQTIHTNIRCLFLRQLKIIFLLPKKQTSIT